MDCRRTKALVALFVEGDLPEPEAEAARDHMRSCADCRSLVAEFEASQAWFRQGGPDFDEEFLADFKRAVLRDVRGLSRKPGRPWSLGNLFNNRLRLAYSMTALLLIGLLAFYASRTDREADSGGELQQASAPVEKEVDSNKHVARGDSIETEPSPETSEASRPPSARRARERKPRAVAPRQRAAEIITSRVEYLDDDAASPGFVKTEVQTSDPRIRIIWLHPKESDEPQTRPTTDF